jgi:hypothetical protein
VGVMDVRVLVKQRQGWEKNVEKNIIKIYAVILRGFMFLETKPNGELL